MILYIMYFLELGTTLSVVRNISRENGCSFLNTGFLEKVPTSHDNMISFLQSADVLLISG